MDLHPKLLFVLLAPLLMAACATTDRTFGAAPSIEVTSLNELPPPTQAVRGYTIGPQEKLQIDVVGVEDLSGIYLTDDVGNIAFPFLSEVQTGGRTPNAAAGMIAKGLRGRYLLDPQVRVVPEELAIPTISIGGEVEKPGRYPALGGEDLTLLRIVNDAEGLTDLAKEDDVLIMRKVGDQNYIGVYNIEAIQRGNYADPQLYAGDIVMVGDSPARRRLENFLQFVPLLSSTAILLERIVR